MSHMNASCHEMSLVAHMNWVMSQVWSESCHTYAPSHVIRMKWVMSHIWMSHVTHLNRVMSNKWIEWFWLGLLVNDGAICTRIVVYDNVDWKHSFDELKVQGEKTKMFIVVTNISISTENRKANSVYSIESRHTYESTNWRGWFQRQVEVDRTEGGGA